MDQLHACPPAEGAAGVLLPGEPEHRLREARLRDGLPLETILEGELDALAEATGAPPLERERA